MLLCVSLRPAGAQETKQYIFGGFTLLSLVTSPGGRETHGNATASNGFAASPYGFFAKICSIFCWSDSGVNGLMM
jgi:hypothetical protein